MTTTSLKVNLHEKSYPIYIGENLLKQTDLIRRHVKGAQVLIVSNKVVATWYLDDVRRSLADVQCDVLCLPDGEQFKTIATLNEIFDTLIEKKHHRSTTLLALGGGVIGDITGFAAACYQRGVDFIQVPTTLLAQVDASIGGKTAVNHPKAKNMIGAFHQPRAVIIDTMTLTTLPEREFCAGLAEVIKAGLIKNQAFFAWLEENMSRLLKKEPDALAYAIEQSCLVKVEIVSEDEKEANIRALLNFGHTFGHAIEQIVGYGKILHGEAVAIGMVLAAMLSEKLGWINSLAVDRVKKVLTMAKLPIRLPNSVTVSNLMNTILLDKKTVGARPRFVLLKSLGSAALTSEITDDDIAAVVSKNTS